MVAAADEALAAAEAKQTSVEKRVLAQWDALTCALTKKLVEADTQVAAADDDAVGPALVAFEAQQLYASGSRVSDHINYLTTRTGPLQRLDHAYRTTTQNFGPYLIHLTILPSPRGRSDLACAT